MLQLTRQLGGALLGCTVARAGALLLQHRAFASEPALDTPAADSDLTPDQVRGLPKPRLGRRNSQPAVGRPGNRGDGEYLLARHLAKPSLLLEQSQVEFKNLADSFAREELLPFSAQWDREHHFPVDTLRRAAELGFGGLYVSEEHGGECGAAGWLPSPCTTLRCAADGSGCSRRRSARR